MKKAFSILAVAGFAALTGAASAQAEQVKVGIAAEPYPPFTVPDASGNWSGWEIDFINAVCDEAKLDCVVTPVAWDGIIPALNSGKIDMIIASMSVTEERKKTIDFTDGYYRSKAIVAGLKDLTFDATPATLADKIMGVQVSTIHMAYAQKHFAPAGTTLREYQTQDEANADLAAGRIDAVQADEIALRDFLASDAGKACCDLKGTVESDPAVMAEDAAIGLRKSDPELKERLNAAIHAIRENGTYLAFNSKYFDFDIY
ncbi:transporter substrate-binding domain-containing protein [Paracoccus sp. MBLB3053]|uniref:Transporter substrate-binding domain-containing protein n=1 Tax=Paracoccus aurantius TaxID=3073814 RepID=A0ABU2HXJ4_9RHOB|nr:transporter substrate-binding domain-containing protein [Paracoccus sp. MBLB3053]MDS9469329.1 transporter substrate-binding domain-containing protein [Paracoccus sp. MBLB3053]